jgi:hypothetical protein
MGGTGARFELVPSFCAVRCRRGKQRADVATTETESNKNKQ